MTMLLTPAFWPFTVAGLVVLALVILEVVSALIAKPLSALLDVIVPDATPGSLFDALNPTGIPWSIYLMILAGAFAALGCTIQASAIGLAVALPTWIAVPVAAITALPVARHLSRILGRWFPRAETYVQNGSDLIGRVGEVTVGPAVIGRVARARFFDQYGNMHFPRVEPVAPDVEIAAGRQVLVVAVKGNVLEVVEVP
ncbi:MAG: DUF1449 family protein [Alphaproteobacteria bacterium]|nr:DUF1449 family protein [Alphaproteobacteria bacterium]